MHEGGDEVCVSWVSLRYGFVDTWMVVWGGVKGRSGAGMGIVRLGVGGAPFERIS